MNAYESSLADSNRLDFLKIQMVVMVHCSLQQTAHMQILKMHLRLYMRNNEIQSVLDTSKIKAVMVAGGGPKSCGTATSSRYVNQSLK